MRQDATHRNAPRANDTQAHDICHNCSTLLGYDLSNGA